MVDDALVVDNWLEEERLAAGYESADEFATRVDIDPASYRYIEAGRILPTGDEFKRVLAVLGDPPPTRLYPQGYLGIIGGLVREMDRQRYKDFSHSASNVFNDLADRGHMLLARDEVRWFERSPGKNHRADVFVNLSCGTQMTPHLLLDTVTALERLDVSFIAAAGSAACCGKPFRTMGRTDVGERVSRTRIKRSLEWGATTHVNWCTACQVTSKLTAERRLHAEGIAHPVREVQVLAFLAERVRELGTEVPWKKSVPCKVMVEGHPVWTPAHRDAQKAAAELLSLVPGVEVIDLIDGYHEMSPCTGHGREAEREGEWKPPDWYLQQDTAEGIRAHRVRLAEYVHSQGADTVACQHQTCHGRWCRYASDQLAIMHPVSVLAEALGCASPDRYQAAVRLGDPGEFVAQTRPVWQSWGMAEERARELAVSICDPKFADASAQRSCGHGNCGNCQENLISVDVLRGLSSPT